MVLCMIVIARESVAPSEVVAVRNSVAAIEADSQTAVVPLRELVSVREQFFPEEVVSARE